MATQGGERPTPSRVRHHHPPPSSRRGGQPRRPSPRQQGTAVDSARNRSRPRRPGRHARDRGPPSDPPQLGAHRGGSPSHRPRSMAQQRVRPSGLLGRRVDRGPRRHQRERHPCAGEAIGSRLKRFRPAHRVAPGIRRPRLGRAVSALRGQRTVRLHRRIRRACTAAAVTNRATDAGGDRMRRSDTGDLWWKNAVFYCADVETFYDWNGDGRGDIRGMTERIEYLFDLGVTCLWLMPFYPTARRDDGYDITDFFVSTHAWGPTATSSNSCAPPKRPEYGSSSTSS